MIFKPLDPTVVFDGTFASWKPATQAVYTVVASIANYETGHFWHKAQQIAILAGLKPSSTRAALKTLAKAGIIQDNPRPGKTTKRCYLFASQLTDEKRQATPPPGWRPPLHQDGGHPSTHVEASSDTLTPQSPTVSQSTESHSGPNNNRGLNKKKTTTGPFSYKLLSKLISEYGRKPVMRRVVVISKMNGRVKNKPALLIASLKEGYIPSDKILRAQEEEEEKKKRAEAARKEHEARIAELDKQDEERWNQYMNDNPDALAAALEILAAN